MKEVVPTILLPLSTTILHRALEILRAIMKHNFIPSILVVAGGVMSLHYSTIIRSNGCPTIIANGPSQTGKSTAMNVALSIMGTFMQFCTYCILMRIFFFPRSPKRSNL